MAIFPNYNWIIPEVPVLIDALENVNVGTRFQMS